MSTTVLIMLLVFGLNTLFWTTVGLGREVASWWVRWRGKRSAVRPGPPLLTPADVAVLVAAHNEELVIAETIASATSLVPAANVFVVSDGSSDRTADIVRAAGARVLELSPNRGKAGALAAGIEHFDLCERFQVVTMLDADTHLAPDYLTTGLAQMSEPGVVAVAGRATTISAPDQLTRFGRLLVAYRERVYVAVQYLLKYGQAARWANAVTIVPGFASMYRTEALKQIDVSAPGLVIEDFNMTFEVHAKQLGRIAFHPRAAIAYTQDPDNFRDYVKQVRRWALGFWQTLRRHRLHVGRFWVALAAYVAELVTSSLLFVLLVPLLLVSVVAGVFGNGAGRWELAGVLPPQAVLLGVLVPDFLLTVLAAVVSRRPHYLLYGLAFPVIRIVDAAMCLRTIPLAWRSRDTGVWRSPTRRSNAKHRAGTVSATPLPVTGSSRSRLHIVEDDGREPRGEIA
ncbi:glycosyltransferase family 2 protein [Prescottella agglutinans]|uniref:Glycosyltransferase family 2 protein n=1 Tax=Prescottella agglutinans TaxID=1644129 RepID=A0A3S3AFX3_9NOCA|nr:glycosyltransferase family 2 protein [Prescottella agglutinans]RVW07216.1 glycosyltransferase family 2 protein [Prescottella agglutinans]